MGTPPWIVSDELWALIEPPLQGLVDFAIVQSYLNTATKWGSDKLHALRQLFTTGAWGPPALTPAE